MSDCYRSSGIFDGTELIIASFLQLRNDQHLKQRSVSRDLKDTGNGDEDFFALISDLYSCIETNRSDRPPSQENWRYEPVTTLSDHNKSPEILLERAVAMLGEAGTLPGWRNQIPVASGHVDDRSDKRAAIDLVELDCDRVQFIELKWESDTPAYAAFEILLYGLVYLFCRANAAKFGYSDQPLMCVSRVDLRVVAPTVYFKKHDLAWLERGLDRAVGRFSPQKTSGQLAMGFDFLSFPPDFELPFQCGAEVRTACKAGPLTKSARRVCDAFDNLSPVWPAAKVSTT